MATCNVVIPGYLTDILKAHQTCILIGTLRDKQIHIAASISCPAFTAEAINKTATDVKPLLPGGLLVCGLSKCVGEEEVTSTQDSFAQLHLAFDGSEPLCLCLVANGSPQATVVDQNGTQRSISVTSTSPDAPTASWRLARVQGKVPFTLCVGDRDSWKSQLNSNIDKLCGSISSSRTKFHLLGSRILLSTAGCIGTDSDSTCDTLLVAASGDTDTGRRKKETKSLEVLNFDMYRDLSIDVTSEQSTYSPIINYNMETVKKCTITLPVDSVAVLEPNSTAEQIAELLSISVSRQLVAMGKCISCYSHGDKFNTPEPYHIKLSEFPAMISVIYPHSVPDDKLVEERRQLHDQFCLPKDRPLFRRANQFVFPDDQASSGYLVNVHESVPPSKVTGGQSYLVQGQYTYHHYMQDRFDDNKWGCAYRSLQTLASWFRFQGYTDRPVPSHRDIQQTLVDIGDKEPKFVGSKLWIGSMEVSFVLDTYLGVTSKILSVSSGAELSSKGRELAAHFSNQGTPIMIGGGVLAHTILGVDYDEVTGDISFLILDPHFTGAEDLKVIVDKGWCGWKGPDFWDKNAHYNMCMPQRPSAL